MYYANHLEDVKSAISELDSKDSAAISTAKALMESESIVLNLGPTSKYTTVQYLKIEALENKRIASGGIASSRQITALGA